MFITVENSGIVKSFGIVDGNIAVVLHEEFSSKTPMLFVYDAPNSHELFIGMSNAESKGRFFNANIRNVKPALPVLLRQPVL